METRLEKNLFFLFVFVLFFLSAAHGELNDNVRQSAGTNNSAQQWEWFSQTIDASPISNSNTNRCFALDSLNSPHIVTGDAFLFHLHIAYSNYLELFYAHGSDGIWNIQSIPTKMWTLPSLALDQKGKPHISIGDSANSAIFYLSVGKSPAPPTRAFIQ